MGFSKKWLLKRGFLGLLILVSSQSYAVDSLYQGTRAEAMGNAFVALADDEEAIFYNPAGLCGLDHYTLTMANAQLGVSNDLLYGYSTFAPLLGKPSVSDIDQLIGKNFYANGQATASLVGPCFGVAGIYDAQGAVRLQNLTVPNGVIGLETTYGSQFGFGIPIRFRDQSELRLGFAAKILWRSGGYQTTTITDLMTFNYQSMIPSLNSTGIGVGADAGLQYIYKIRKDFTLQWGAAFTDIGTTSFAGGADRLPSDLTMGVATQFKTRDLRVTLSYDYDHVLDYMDWRMKTHLGLELKFPIFSLYGGLNEFYPTYGIGVDLFFFKIMYASYAEELGTLAGQDPERRTMLSISFRLEI